MPRTDVPPPGQGKRSQRKAWRDNADHAIAIYGLTAQETSEAVDTEELEATSHALPYWDDDVPQPQPQSQSRSHSYTEEDIQELVDKAYQDGWQEGLEEGYKIGKDKAHKEHKEQEEQEAKKAKNQTNEVAETLKDTRGAPSIVTRVNATSQTDPTGPKSRASINVAHSIPSSPIFSNTATWHPELFSAAPRSSTSSTTLTPSSAKVQNIKNIDSAIYNSTTSSNNIQAAHLDTGNTYNDISDPYVVYSTPHIIPSGYRSDPEYLAGYNSPTSSDNTQDTYLDAGNASYDVSVPYVAYSDPLIALSSNQNNPRKNPSSYTPTAGITIPDARNDGATLLLVDVGTQDPPSTFETSQDIEKTPLAMSNISTLPQQLPPLPSMQPLNPAPYKRASTPLEMSHTLTEPKSDSILPEKPTTAHKSGHFHTPGNNLSNSPVAASEHHIQSLTTPSFIIHTQTVIVNNYVGANSSTIKNGSTTGIFGTTNPTPTKNSARNSEDEHQAPAPPTAPATQPQDFSVLCSHRRRPFSSLQRRSRRRQSVPVRGFNWDGNGHNRDFSRAPQAWGWTAPVR